MGGVLIDNIEFIIIFHQPVSLKKLPDDPVAGSGFLRKQTVIKSSIC